VARTGIKDGREQGPQKNKWGYVNNPRWQISPMGPLHYESGGEPQVWDPDQKKFVTGEIKVHIPCGHWHTPQGEGGGGNGGEGEGNAQVFFGGAHRRGVEEVDQSYSWQIESKNPSTSDQVWLLDDYVALHMDGVFKLDIYDDALYAIGALQTWGMGWLYEEWQFTILEEYEWTVERRDTTKTLIWRKTYGSGIPETQSPYITPAHIRGVAADDTGVYCAGEDYQTGYTQLRAEKRNKDTGEIEWEVIVPRGSNYWYVIDCAIDSEYLYVTYYNPSYPSATGKVMAFDKVIGSYSIVYTDTTYSMTADTHAVPYKLQISTADKLGTGLDNVYIVGNKHLKPLDSSWETVLDYHYVFVTSVGDMDMAIDSTGIYTCGMINPHSPIIYCAGYEVCKWDFDGNQIWATQYTDGITGLTPYTTGPYCQTIAVNSVGVFVAANVQPGTVPAVNGIQQAFNKETGAILWTDFWAYDDRSTTNGVAANDITA
jgi:hypothetical protein